jgi:hypothetical protein
MNIGSDVATRTSQTGALRTVDMGKLQNGSVK